MKRITNTSFRICAVWIGTMIGAGFASGREILQFFGSPSEKSGTAIVFAVFMLILICRRILTVGFESGSYNLNDYLAATGGRTAKYIKYFMLLFMFSGLSVMFAASGALFSQTFGITPAAGIFLMAIICFFIFIFDVRGITALNCIVVPLMLAGLIYISVYSSMTGSRETFSYFVADVKKFPFLSALCYVSYNTITLSAVLIPLCKDIDKKQIRIISITGGSVLGLLILIIWTSMGLRYEHLLSSEIPMMHLAAVSGKLCKNVYTVVLFLSICTTAVSDGFGILAENPPKNRFSYTLRCAILCISAVPLALFGFSGLVENLYTIFGIFGFFMILTLIPHKQNKIGK